MYPIKNEAIDNAVTDFEDPTPTVIKDLPAAKVACAKTMLLSIDSDDEFGHLHDDVFTPTEPVDTPTQPTGSPLSLNPTIKSSMPKNEASKTQKPMLTKRASLDDFSMEAGEIVLDDMLTLSDDESDLDSVNSDDEGCPQIDKDSEDVKTNESDVVKPAHESEEKLPLELLGNESVNSQSQATVQENVTDDNKLRNDSPLSEATCEKDNEITDIDVKVNETSEESSAIIETNNESDDNVESEFVLDDDMEVSDGQCVDPVVSALDPAELKESDVLRQLADMILNPNVGGNVQCDMKRDERESSVSRLSVSR